MAKRGIRSDRPFPSVPDTDAPSGAYDEPAIEKRPDVMPTRTFHHQDATSLADLRLRVEQLLQRREAADDEMWRALGPDVVPLLLHLVDDVTVIRNEALRDRVLATLGQLRAAAAVPRLAQVLLNPKERLSTRALAANAMGRIGDASATPFLAQAARDKDATIRRQVAIALGRVGRGEAVPHLRVLAADRSPIVVEAAEAALRQQQERLGVSGLAAAPRRRAKAAAARPPAPERKR
jgi:HEAT repeat protein